MLTLFLKIICSPFRVLFSCLWSLIERNKLPNYSSDIVLITGGGQGLGRELALHFSECGATVVLWDIQESKLRQTCSDITAQGREAFGYVVDCSNKEQIYQTADRVRQEVGNVSILVNNVGMLPGKLITEFDEGQFEKTINVNFISHYWTICTFLPWMIDNNYGHIIETCSISAFISGPLTSDYNSSKAALVNFCESLHYELMVTGKTGINVTCICPGAIDTQFIKHTKRVSAIVNALAKGRMLTPRRAAELVLKAVAQKKFIAFIPSHMSIVITIAFLLPRSLKDAIVRRMLKSQFSKLFQEKE